MSVYALWEPYQRGYLIQPWFVFTFIIIYAFHTLIDRLSQRRRLFLGIILFLLLFSYGYDLLAAIFLSVHLFSLQPQYRLWTWLLFYLTGILFNDPLASSWFSRDNVVKTVTLSIPFIYLFTWYYERHFFFTLFKTDKNAFILTGSQIYVLVVALMIAANGVRFRKHVEIKEKLLATLSKAMTGVYIFHYSIFHLLMSFVIINSLAAKLTLILVTFIISVLISILALSNSVTKRLITI